MGGGGGGGLGQLFNVGNRNFRDTKTQAIMNVIDPAGSTGMVLGMTGAFGEDQYRAGGDTPASGVVDYPEVQPVTEEVPVDETAAATARASARRKKKQQAQSQTIYTSSLGVTDQADISRKTLLGN